MGFRTLRFSKTAASRVHVRRRRIWRPTLLLLVLVAVFTGPGSAKPAYAGTTITVNTTSDEALTDGKCSLREAINNANANTDTTGGDCVAGSPGADTIDLSALNGTITLVPRFLGGLGDLPNITDDLTISGPGADKLTINADGNDRVFFNFANTTVAGVTATGAFASCGDTFGGGIVNWGSGTLAIEDSAISGNTNCFRGGGVVTAIFGGSAPVMILDSTISGNSGDGIFNNCCVHLDVTNSTIAFNTDSIGAGILNNGTLSLVNSTIAGNTSPVIGECCTGAGILNNGVATFQNTIVAGNSPDNCFSDAVESDAGYNLSADASCGFDSSNHSLLNTDPQLDPAGLQDNGGPTKTIALMSGSPAIDAIPPGVNGCGTTITTDQRGVTRPQGAGCDVGAFEFVPPPADLSITKSAAPSPVLSGARLTYTLTVSNNGPKGAPGVIVTDPLPDSLHFNSVASTQGACSRSATMKPPSKSGTINCRVGSLANGASATITIIVTATTPGMLSNQATVSGDVIDPNPFNNIATATTTVIGT